MKKIIDEIADDVINGWYGNGEERKAKLQNHGYNYSEVQAAVNEKMKTRYTYATEMLKFRITIGCVVHEEYQPCEFSDSAISIKINELYRFYESITENTVHIEFVYDIG